MPSPLYRQLPVREALIYPGVCGRPILGAPERRTCREGNSLFFPEFPSAFLLKSSFKRHLVLVVSCFRLTNALVPFVVAKEKDWRRFLCSRTLDGILRRIVDGENGLQIVTDLRFEW